jgi:hypothetical protein
MKVLCIEEKDLPFMARVKRAATVLFKGVVRVNVRISEFPSLKEAMENIPRE